MVLMTSTARPSKTSNRTSKQRRQIRSRKTLWSSGIKGSWSWGENIDTDIYRFIKAEEPFFTGETSIINIISFLTKEY